MPEMVLLQGEPGSKTILLLCPVCHRIISVGLVRPFNGSNNFKLTNKHICPVCNLEYDVCKRDGYEKYQQNLESYLSDKKEYNEAIKRNYQNSHEVPGDPLPEASKSKSDPSHTSFINNAQNAAAIVSEGIESGDYVGIESQLKELIGESGRDAYVFPYGSKKASFITIALSMALSSIFLYLQLWSLRVVVYSEAYHGIGIAGIIIGGIVILANILIIIGRIRELNFARRYTACTDILKYRTINIVEDIADFIKANPRMMIRDLNRAIKRKLIPQGHFGRNSFVFMVSDEDYEKYKQRPAVYDRYYRKRIEERERMKTRTPEVEDILIRGKEYLQKIRDSNALINDSRITAKLDQMERVVAAIFHEVDVNPKQADKLGVFMNYYLPTTEKLLETYIDIEEKIEKGATLRGTLVKISGSLDNINAAFETLLEQFYKEQALDVASEVSAMEIIMKQEGLGAY